MVKYTKIKRCKKRDCKKNEVPGKGYCKAHIPKIKVSEKCSVDRCYNFKYKGNACVYHYMA